MSLCFARLPAAVCLIVLGGCASSHRPPEDAVTQAQRSAASVGVAPALTAQLSLRIAPQGGDATTFNLHVAIADDGRMQATVRKVDIAVLSAVIAADGAYLARDDRAKVWTRGSATQAERSGLLTDLRLLADELRYGPFSHGEIRPATTTDRVRCGTAEIRLVLGSPAEKRILRADGSTRLHLAYGPLRDYGGLHRPSAATVELPAAPGATAADRIQARLVRLTAVPGFTTGRFDLAPPADATFLDLDAFLDGIGR